VRARNIGVATRSWCGRRFGGACVIAGIVVALVAVGGASSRGPAIGSAPPEIAANAAAGWPEHNYDLSNSRADLRTEIDAADVSTLKQRWTFKLSYDGGYGAFTSNPIVLDGVVYLEDPDSDVFALDEKTGALLWEHAYKSVTPSGGPNGVALGYGLLFGETEGAVFALDPKNGKQVWMHTLITNSRDGIDMAPQLYDGKVLISTIPGNSSSYYTGGAYGTVYALAAQTGKAIWSFSTVKGGGTLWGNPKENGGGGLWYPPAVDSSGRVFIGVANPAPYPNSPADPNAKSRPGANLYTDSLVALNGDTGKLLWYQQVTPHDVRDYDFQDPPIVTTQSIGGKKTEIVIGAGKSGKVVAFRADDGKRLWTLDIGDHNKYEYGLLPAKPVVYCPGSLGGVLTPMAESGNVLYVPWIDLCLKASATTAPVPPSPVSETGDLAAVNAATGVIIWKRTFKSLDAGAATVANNVVFTSTFNGTIYALSTKNGSVLWSTKAPAGVNSFPAVTKTMLIVGAGAPTSGSSKPNGVIVAYSLGGK
jgi:outer membrane protein assembly factor BamB